MRETRLRAYVIKSLVLVSLARKAQVASAAIRRASLRGYARRGVVTYYSHYCTCVCLLFVCTLVSSRRDIKVITIVNVFVLYYNKEEEHSFFVRIEIAGVAQNPAVRAANT